MAKVKNKINKTLGTIVAKRLNIISKNAINIIISSVMVAGFLLLGFGIIYLFYDTMLKAPLFAIFTGIIMLLLLINKLTNNSKIKQKTNKPKKNRKK